MRRCVLIVGQGRSGTNWLHDMLNFSPETFCRNEPNEIVGSQLGTLAGATIADEKDDSFGRLWDDAVAWAATHLGERDRNIAGPKNHFYEISRRLGLSGIYRRPRVRAALRRVFRAMRPGEWALPWWLGPRPALADAVVVLKFTQVPGWATWVIRHRPATVVLHIVRHPGGFLNSWLKRYCAGRDTTEIKRANVDRLEGIAASDAVWAERFGDIRGMSLEETELWYWRYANEVIWAAGRGAQNYSYVNYEALASDAVDIMREIYSLCGMRFSESIKTAIEEQTRDSTAIAGAWRRQLSPTQIQLVERFLESAGAFYTPIAT